jgi:hypothetical protein
MKKTLLGLVAALAVWGGGSAGACRAQAIYLPPPPNPAAKPLANPYYNQFSPFGLLRPYGPGGMNYGPGGMNYGPARQGFETTPGLFGVPQQLVGQPLPAYQADAATGLAVTGHPSRFFNYSHYYFSPLIGGGGLTYGAAIPAGTGLLSSMPRAAATPAQTGTNGAGQPPKPTTK